MQDRSMNRDSANRPSLDEKQGGGSARSERQSRQSAALRENLRRRKQQARERSDAGEAAPTVKKNRP